MCGWFHRVAVRKHQMMPWNLIAPSFYLWRWRDPRNPKKYQRLLSWKTVWNPSLLLSTSCPHAKLHVRGCVSRMPDSRVYIHFYSWIKQYKIYYIILYIHLCFVQSWIIHVSCMSCCIIMQFIIVHISVDVWIRKSTVWKGTRWLSQPTRWLHNRKRWMLGSSKEQDLNCFLQTPSESCST